MSKRYICKRKFHVCYHFLDIYESPRRKNFINPSCPKHPKIINWNKKWHNFYVHNSLWCLRNINTFLKVFIKQNWYFQKVTAKYYELFPGKLYQAILLSLSDVNLYFKSLLTAIIVNNTFRTVFDFKKLKIVYCWDIYHFLLWCQASAFLQ